MFGLEIMPGVLDLVTLEPRDKEPETTWVAIDPDTMYQKTYEYLVVRLRNPEPPMPPLQELYMRAKAIQLGNYRGSRLRTENPQLLQAMDRMIRNEILDILRLYFTESLHQSLAGGKIGLHITKDVRYKV